MTLVDTSVWVDHLRRHDAVLAALLDRGEVLGHAFVVGELACGSLGQRSQVLPLLAALPQARLAFHAEVLSFVERQGLMGVGIGCSDAHLLAGVAVTPEARLWTRDRRLASAAQRLRLDAAPTG